MRQALKQAGRTAVIESLLVGHLGLFTEGTTHHRQGLAGALGRGAEDQVGAHLGVRHVALHQLAGLDAARCQRAVEILELRVVPARLRVAKEVDHMLPILGECRRRLAGGRGRLQSFRKTPHHLAQPLLVEAIGRLLQRYPLPSSEARLKPVRMLKRDLHGKDFHGAGAAPLLVSVAPHGPDRDPTLDAGSSLGFLRSRGGRADPGIHDALRQHPSGAFARGDQQDLDLTIVTTIGQHRRLPSRTTWPPLAHASDLPLLFSCSAFGGRRAR